MRDVVVIGAGPAGSITARILAEAGRDVLVLEEHDAIGAPVHCTGLLGFDAFDEFDLPRDLILGRAGAARLWGAAGRSVMVHSERVEAAVIDRARLDLTLARRAEHAGAEVRTGCRVGSISVGPRSVSVTGRGFTGDRRGARVRARLRRQLPVSSSARPRDARGVPAERAARDAVSRRPADRSALRPDRRARRIRVARAVAARPHPVRAHRPDGHRAQPRSIRHVSLMALGRKRRRRDAR